MKSNLQNGLLGIVWAALASILPAGSAFAQFPFPELSSPELAAPKVAAPEIAAPEIAAPERVAPERVAQKPADEDADVIAVPRLVDVVPSSSDLSTGEPTAAELRQARAQFRSQQRMERMERNLWAGYEPLRPNWNSIPMMSSRYPYRQTVVVPLYVYPR
ncbi:hypothetical protein Enr13x_60990 [Stieleria neptunia]|uniref:Uncharacterized protein n=1 Tax=Stieleria neptunia TaxID=2527979 RepID=A0A518HZB7_9BACT|nr:hypothetical protein [Stieleria neptunia]QDV46190.1 hypothetical protein Enr13x_60990 [Stieleria neptunia]